MSLFYKTILVLIFTLSLSEVHASICNISGKIIFIGFADGARVAKLDLPKDWEAIKESNAAAILDFKNKVRSMTSVDQKYLINRQREFFKDFPTIAKRMTQIYDENLGRIDQAGCLETWILSSIFYEYPNDPEVEFSVYVLKGNTSQKYRAYVLTWGLNHVPESADLIQLIDRDLREGWQYYINLHNHPFFFNNPTGDIGGVVVPSEPDFTFYLKDQQQRGLQNAWVTNGFNTFKLKNSDFNK